MRRVPKLLYLCKLKEKKKKNRDMLKPLFKKEK